MQKTAYYCDHCKRVIGDIVHISFETVGQYSGLALPPHVAQLEKWIVEPKIAGFLHFHITCIEPYFKKLAKPYLTPKK